MGADSELVFTFDSQSFSDASSVAAPSKSFKVITLSQARLCGMLARGLCASERLTGAAETKLQRLVSEELLNSQHHDLHHHHHLLPQPPCGQEGGCGQSCGSSTPPLSPFHSLSPFPFSPSLHPSSCSLPTVALKQLCLTLRLQGADARLFLPVPQPGPGCGRQSTGGGGQCAAGAPGQRCFFCSRQPYALIRCPPAWVGGVTAGELRGGGGDGGGDGDGGGPGQEQQLPQRPHPLEALTAASEPFRSGEGMSPPSSPSSAPPPWVIEPGLRELFRVAPSTPEYAALVEGLPLLWVGPRTALLELADRLCAAMAINFRIQGLDVPPWRRRAVVLSRWDERHQQEVPLGVEAVPVGGLLPTVLSASAGGEEVAAPPRPRPQKDDVPAAPMTSELSSGATATATATAWACGCGPGGFQRVATIATAAAAGAGALRGGGAMTPSLIVYGFELPGPARAV